jgi:hypothetical protein
MSTLMGVRFVHGLAGGMQVGLAFSIIARTVAPDRTFGMLLLVQVLAGGLGLMGLPLLVPRLGSGVVFAALILFSLIALVMLQFLPDYPVGERSQRAAADSPRTKPLVQALASVFLFQAANMGLFAFIIGLGRRHGLEIDFISETLGLANWLSVAGALLVIALSTRYGIFKPVLGGIFLSLIGTWAFSYCETKWIWIAANVGTGITWNFVISHLLGMCSRFDKTGQAAVWSGFASKMGLATGPMLASLIVGAGNYPALIATAVALLALAMLSSSLPALTLDREAAAT